MKLAAPSKWEWVLLSIILLAAALLRFPGLGDNPPGLFHDELEKGYTAWELIHTGRHGSLGAGGVSVSSPMPLFIEVYTDHDKTSALYQYLTAPIVGAFGLNGYTTRFWAAMAGFLSVVAVWWLARSQIGIGGALIAAGAMAVQPTGLLFSRWAQQGILLVALVPCGLALLAMIPRAQERHQRALAVCGGIVLGLAAYAYAPGRLVVPLLLAGFLVSRGTTSLREHRNAWLIAGITFAVIWIPLLVYTLTAGSARLERVVGGEGSMPLRVIGNYLAHFHPLFLFISGDANARHGLPGTGLVGWGSGLMLIAGIAAAIRAVYRREDGRRATALLLLIWLLAAPAAAALTNEGIPHALRANLMIPVGALLAGCSAWWFDTQARLLGVGAAVLLLIDLGLCGLGLKRLAESDPWPWEAGLQEAMAEGLENPGAVYLSAQIPYASYVVLFAEKTDPAEFHELGMLSFRTRIVPQIPELRPGDIYITPPFSNLPMDYFSDFVVIYEGTADGVIARRTEELWR